MDCCSSKGGKMDVSSCPACRGVGLSVKVRTMKHWVAADRVPLIPEIPFYYCRTRDCSVVYFSGDHSIRYMRDDIRYPIGQKGGSGPVSICYCFGVTEEMIRGAIRRKESSDYSAWIAKEVKAGNCACDVRNPTGRCCLGDVKRVEKVYGNKRTF